jgi:ABC-2 type transport system ATP-binding protein
LDETAVECHGLTRQFGARTAVADLELSVPRGTVFGFLGPNGAGKTTTVRMMVGMLRPSAGSIRVLGLNPIAQGEAVRARCGVMLDQVGLYERLSALQNLEFAARVAHLSKADARTRIEEALNRVELWDRRFDRVGEFSKGMRQKLGLARALIAQPDMLILDEPTAGLDPENIVMVRDLLMTLAQESHSIFLCTHLLAEAQRICQRVAIIQNGRLLAVGAPDSIGKTGVPSARLTVTESDPARMEQVLLPHGAQVSSLGYGQWRVTMAAANDIEAIVRALVEAQIGVRAVIPEETSLEESYLQLVGGNGHA